VQAQLGRTAPSCKTPDLPRTPSIETSLSCARARLDDVQLAAQRSFLHRYLACLLLHQHPCSSDPIRQLCVPKPLSITCSGHVNGFAGHAGSFASGNQQEKQFQQPKPDISPLSKELQQQWHFDRNAHLGSVIITPGSNRKVWWSCDQCPDGVPHVWESLVNNRTQGRGCPYCSGRSVCQHNTLARKAQEVAQYWDRVKNGSVCPKSVTANSSLRAHWKCPICLYEWQASIQEKVNFNTACPKCARGQFGREQGGPRKKHPTFASNRHPLLQQWHHKLNEKEGHFPDKTTLQSSKRIWWICDLCPKGKPHICTMLALLSYASSSPISMLRCSCRVSHPTLVGSAGLGTPRSTE